MSPLQTILVLCVIRMSAIVFNQTAFVPDEHWQSLEVAHKMTFGYGNMTWEWKEGIRSYFYPSLIAASYKILEVVGMDSVKNLIFVPRLLQTLASVISDYCFWLWIRKETGTTGSMALFSLSTSWFWFYCCSRTLTNTLETVFTTYALFVFPWKVGASTTFLWFVGLACIVRPTAAVIWVPLCLHHVLRASKKKALILQGYLPIMAFLFVTSTMLDSYFYNRLVISPLNFLHFNIMKNISEFYGKHPVSWYITSGIPVVLGVHLIPFLLGILNKSSETFLVCKKTINLLAISIIWTVIVYSCLPHKEFRFIMPLLPMVLFISTCWLIGFHRTGQRYLVGLLYITLILGAAVPALYLGLLHQRGTLDVMNELATDAVADPDHTDVLFLMPCHSTPLYSHLHVNISTRFLTCDPFFDLYTMRDEADLFYFDPVPWLTTNYNHNGSLPSHVVMFDVLYPHVSKFLSSYKYSVSSCIFHAHLVEGRIGQYIYILKQSVATNEQQMEME